ncbi:MAG: hypothetical protein OJF47_003351 [Nitrospira sp.]|jgi:hypothetical protein|nr:MAG: hypothetical protein OJF47_003351 [Nitrospira sp.]
MRIAHVSPFFEEVSIEGEGSESRGVAFLARGLVRFGHDVTVFASGDSRVSGSLVPVSPLALRHYPTPKRHLSEGLAFLALDKAFSATTPFDLIHVHAGFAAFPLMRRSPLPTVATVYGSLDAPEVVKVYREFRELALVATSMDQVRQCPELNWQAVVPWHLPPRQDGPCTETLDALVETAMAYTAVYERLVAGWAERRQSFQPLYSFQGAESRV